MIAQLCLVLLLIVPLHEASTLYQIDLDFNVTIPDTLPPYENVTINVTEYNLVDTITIDDISLSGQGVEVLAVWLDNGTILPQAPLLQVEKYIELTGDPADVKFFISVANYGLKNASNVIVRVNLKDSLEADYGTMDYAKYLPSNPVKSDIDLIDGKQVFEWKVTRVKDLQVNESMNISFTANIRGDKNRELAEGMSYYFTDVYWNDTDDANAYGLLSDEFGPLEVSVCLKRNTKVIENLFYQHGFTALAFFMALILGCLLVLLGFFIFFLIKRKKSVSPTRQTRMKREKTLMLNENEALKKGGHTITDYSNVGEGDSIVGTLSLKDKSQMHREIDSMDIVVNNKHRYCHRE